MCESQATLETSASLVKSIQQMSERLRLLTEKTQNGLALSVCSVCLSLYEGNTSEVLKQKETSVFMFLVHDVTFNKMYFKIVINNSFIFQTYTDMKMKLNRFSQIFFICCIIRAVTSRL